MYKKAWKLILNEMEILYGSTKYIKLWMESLIPESTQPVNTN